MLEVTSQHARFCSYRLRLLSAITEWASKVVVRLMNLLVQHYYTQDALNLCSHAGGSYVQSVNCCKVLAWALQDHEVIHNRDQSTS